MKNIFFNLRSSGASENFGMNRLNIGANQLTDSVRMWKQRKMMALWLEWYINRPRNSSNCQETPEARRGMEAFSSRDFRERTALLTPWPLILISRIARQQFFLVLCHLAFFFFFFGALLQQPRKTNSLTMLPHVASFTVWSYASSFSCILHLLQGGV